MAGPKDDEDRVRHCRIDLIDTRKRPRRSSSSNIDPRSSSPTPHRQQNPHPSKVSRNFFGDTDLRRIVCGHRMPDTIFGRLESRWIELKDEATRASLSAAANAKEARKSSARGLEIAERCERIHVLKEEKEKLEVVLSRMDERVQEMRKEVEGLQGVKGELEAFVEMQNGFIEIGTGALKNLRTKLIKGESENEGLRGIVEQQEMSIASLHDLISQMQSVDLEGDAGGYQEMVGLALEVQAQRTLGMVQGLRREVDEKDGVIGALEWTVKVREEEVRGLEESLDKKGSLLEGTEHKRVQQENVIEQLREAVGKWKGKEADARKLAEDQQNLIDRLLRPSE